MSTDRLQPTIRPATAADRAAWLPLWRGYQHFYRTSIDDETTDFTWARILDPRVPMHCALAEVDVDGRPEVVGLVHYLTHPSFWTRGDYCYLQDLFVSDGIRARGIGRRLIEHVCQEAAAAGCSRVWWLTHETNTDAMKLYEQVAERPGFVQYRRML